MTKEDNSLTHIAIIMDGNGRWAAKRGLPRSFGHKKGAETVKEITRAAGEAGIRFLTLYAFSTENWQRSPEEVSTLMGLLRQYLKTDLQELRKNNVRIRFIGERDMLDADIVAAMEKLEAETAVNDGLTLCIALSYGSRQEIVNAAKKAAAFLSYLSGVFYINHRHPLVNPAFPAKGLLGIKFMNIFSFGRWRQRPMR